jgi:hypothetical protein
MGPVRPDQADDATCTLCGHPQHQHVETRSGTRPPRVFCVAHREDEERNRTPLCGCTHFVSGK